MTIYVICVDQETGRTLAFPGDTPTTQFFAYTREAAICGLIELLVASHKAEVPPHRRSIYIDDIVDLPNREIDIR